MARFALGVVCGMIISAVAGAAFSSRAQEEEDDPGEIPAETLVTAIRVGIDPRALHGAVVTTHAAGAVAYLQAEGLLPKPPPEPAHPPELIPTPAVRQSLVDCIIWRESRGNPRAVNPRSGASGLGQFLASTWRTTPQGRAGYSVFDPTANRAAVAWMISVGRGREFVTIGGC